MTNERGRGFFDNLSGLPRIEATVGSEDDFDVFHIRPAETAPAPWEPIVDALSLNIQASAKKAGITLPDLRFRILTNPDTDNIHGSHFGTLNGAKKKAENIRRDK